MSILSLVWFGLGCFLLGLCFLGGVYSYTAFFSLPCFFLSWFATRINKPAGLADIRPSEELPLKKSHALQNSQAEVSISSLKEKRRRYLRELEEIVDRTLLDGLAVLKQAVNGYSYGIFVPDRVDGLFLRIWMTDSQVIIPGAKISKGQGLVGLLMKEEISRVLEQDIVTNSSQLYYYSDNEDVRSLAGVPIVVNGVRRGAVIVDSQEKKAFGEETISVLHNFASMIGQFMYAAYTNLENGYQRDQLAALTTYQRKFLENMSEDEIIYYLEDYISQSIEADRFMLIGLEGERAGDAKVLFCKGLDENYFKAFTFNLEEKGFIRVVFEKEQIISKTFNRQEKLPRFSPRERINDNIRCLFAVPVRTDKGITHVLCMESSRRKNFTDHQKELFLTISRAAGFALARARLYEEKKEMSRRDGLTGLINHKTFQEQYKSEIMRAQRDEYLITVLMLDIDFFKQVNDRYGHPMGDVVLKDVAQLVGQVIRGGHDTVARYGGEEFVAMLTQTSVEKAKETAERIRQAIQAREYDTGGKDPLKITMSIGGAIYPTDSKYGKEVLEKADKALYHAKKTGRNRIVFYSE